LKRVSLILESPRFIVTSAPGLEKILAEELRSFGIEPAVEPSGAVTFSGDWGHAATVLIGSRIAGRVHVSLRRFASGSRAMLYDQVRRLDWPSLFSSLNSFSVNAFGSVEGSDFVLSYAPLRIKDAVCDEFRKRGHLRPNVDRQHPDMRLSAFFFEGRCELSMDLSGDALHRRGYRKEGAEAPLRENRAAALLAFCGYDGSRPFVDPFCGSGTLAIEAALIATRTAPGLLRPVDRFAMARFFPETSVLLEEAQRRAASARLELPPCPIIGSDLSREVLVVARANARRAGMEGAVRFEAADAREITAPDSWIVTNPPYGERLGDPAQARDLLDAFVRRVKHHAAGSTLGLVLPRGDLEKSVGLRPEKRLAVESGPLGLRYLCFAMRAGRFLERGTSQ
jgi:putative N6-adenine-specific DNA methylase